LVRYTSVCELADDEADAVLLDSYGKTKSETMTKTKKKNIYPPMILLLISGFLIFSAWSAFQAAGFGSKVTDADYYSKGLKYNQTRIEAKAAEAMGWRVNSSLKKHKLTVTLNTDDQEPVSGCRGEIVIFNNEKRLSLPLQENSLGDYTTEIPADLAGSLTGDLLLHRDGARINRRLLINL
jgi:hypothetical protein